ncbi:MAG: DUF2085 domain-containing protein [Chloroflexota bacterium]|nr:DUF2085 domain-containing protein [Chloroflexota bacterium]
MIEVILYTRKDCRLCEQTRSDLDELQSQFPHRLSILDIDENPDLAQKFGFEIPVVQINSYLLKAPISKQELLNALEASQELDQNSTVRDQKTMQENASGSARSTADGIAYWITKHYLAIFNMFVLFYVGLPFLAPVFMRAGYDLPAKMIYRGYGLLCHQLSYRSFFLFGEQPVYPRAAAGIDDLMTYGEATGLSEGNQPVEVFAARDYVGDELVGYKVALCQRDIALWGGLLLFGLLFGITNKRIPGLPWYLWILIGLVPIGVDGLSQIISQPPLGWLPYRESTPFFRIITGFLFGFSTAWFAYPLVEEAMSDTRELMDSRRSKV